MPAGFRQKRKKCYSFVSFRFFLKQTTNIYKMSRRMVFLYFGVVLYGNWLCQQALCQDPNIRYHGPMLSQKMSRRLNYSYVNLKKLPGYRLSVVPFSTTTVRNLTKCYSECLKTNGRCKSMNVERSPESSGIFFSCSLLETDIFRHPSKLMKEVNSTHFAIMVQTYVIFYDNC